MLVVVFSISILSEAFFGKSYLMIVEKQQLVL